MNVAHNRTSTLVCRRFFCLFVVIVAAVAVVVVLEKTLLVVQECQMISDNGLSDTLGLDNFGALHVVRVQFSAKRDKLKHDTAVGLVRKVAGNLFANV